MHSCKLNNVLTKFVCLTCVVAITGCETDPTVETEKSKDARVIAFSLPDNSKITKSLSKYIFAIDHNTGLNTNGVIENNDSLPLGTDISLNMLASISFSGASKAELIFEDDEKRVNYSPTDSIKFSRGVTLDVTAFNENVKKSYKLKVNVHKENPDSTTWSEIRNTLSGTLPNSRQVTFAENIEGKTPHFQSFFTEAGVLKRTDLQTAQTVSYAMAKPNIESITQTPNGYYLINEDGQLMLINTTLEEPQTVTTTSYSTIYGYVADGNTNYLIVKEKTTQQVLALSLSDHTTTKLPTVTPAELSDLSTFTRLNNQPTSMNYNSLTIVGVRGELTHQSSFQFYIYGGLLHISNDIAYPLDKKVQLPAFKSPAIFYYNSAIWAIGAEDTKNYIYTSLDFGRTWSKQTKNITIPKEYTPRSETSACVIDSKYIYLFGGKEKGQNTQEVWRGKINKVDHKFYFPAK